MTTKIPVELSSTPGIVDGSNATAITIDSSENVGVGTTSPAVLNHISAGYSAPTNGIDSNVFSLISNSASTGSYAGLGILAGTAAASFIHFGDTDDMNVGTLDYFHSDNSMRFSTNATERMRIDSSGNVFFGKTGHDFDAVGAELFAPTGYMSITRNQGTQLYLHRMNNDGAFVEFWQTNNLEGYVNVSSGTVTLENYSDYRMKKNISDLGSSLDRVKSLRPVTFEYTRHAGYTHEGFIAHEVQEVLPQAVQGDKDAVNEEGEPVYQSYDKSLLIPLLTKAIQEQQTQIEALQSEINTLKGE